MLFIPAMVFGLLCDVEIIVQVFRYQPIAFKETPRFCREILLVTSILSFLMSGALILFSFLAFTPVISPVQFLKIFFSCLVIKAVTWSPFIALEIYDTIFENVYFDVQWQLNPIEPGKAS